MKVEKREKTKELYAIASNETGEILYTSGGSSHNPKLMVYGKEISARRALASQFTVDQVINYKIKIIKIYDSTENNLALFE